MSKELVFGIDCDEVLRQTLSSMVKLYNKEFNSNMQMSDIKDFVVENSFPLVSELTGMTAGEWFFQLHSKEIFVDSIPFKNIINSINTLKKYGKVIIITYQKSYKNKFETLDWLEKNGVEPDGVCFLKDKTLLHIDYLVDDNDWNFIGSNATHAILINAPYNLGKSDESILAQSNCADIKRYDKLEEFVSDFEKQQELQDCYLFC